jgi:hypothetical protein
VVVNEVQVLYTSPIAIRGKDVEDYLQQTWPTAATAVQVPNTNFHQRIDSSTTEKEGISRL